MTISFIEGFDHLTIATINQKWNSTTGVPTIVVGRTGNAVQFANLSAAVYLVKALPAAKAVWIVGFAFRVTVMPAAFNWPPMLSFTDGGTEQSTLRLQPDGTLIVTRSNVGFFQNSNVNQLGISTNALLLNTWYYIECKMTIGNAGAVEVRVNGSSSGWINVGPVDTQYSANPTANGFVLGIPSTGAATMQFDDLYAMDVAVAPNNDFLGDSKVETLRPDNPGATTQWDIGGTVPAATNWESVDDTTPDGDVTTVTNTVLNEVDTYRHTDLAALSANIVAVQVNLSARKDDAGARSIAPVVRPAATDRVGTTVALTTSFADVRQVYDVSPETTLQWSLVEVNGTEFGVKLTV